jgi:hypothetical protein
MLIALTLPPFCFSATIVSKAGPQDKCTISKKIPGSFEPGIDVIIEQCPILFSSLHQLI